VFLTVVNPFLFTFVQHSSFYTQDINLNSELVHNATATLAITADQLQFDERRKSLNTDTITVV